MEKKALIKKLLSKKTKDYSYTIAFFLIFSFFLLAVIRPNVLSVFSANEKIIELEKQNKFYDSQILYIINIQSALESNRENLYLLKEAISQSPQVNKILSDINSVLEKNKLIVNKINIGELSLKESNEAQKLKTVDFHTDLTGSFGDLKQLIDDLYDQRRLKLIQQLKITKDDIVATNSAVASNSANLKINLNIEGYYL